MFFLNNSFQITRVAGSLTEWLEQDHEALVGESATSLVSTSDRVTLQTALEQVTETKSSQSVACHFVASAETMAVDIDLVPVESGPEPGTIIGTVHRQEKQNSQPVSQLDQLRNFIKLLNDAAVVYELVNTEPIVKAVNSPFEETFGYKAEFIVDNSLNDYIVPSTEQQEANRFDKQIADGSVATSVVRRQTTSGIQKFAYRGLPISRTSGRDYGVAIYADMTEKQQARQHIRVLHRVLRHNLRNELTVILGMAEQITDTSNSETVQKAANRIIDRAEDLDAVSSKARIAEGILGDSPSDTVVEVGSTVGEVVADAQAEWPEATIQTDIETPLPVSSGLEIKDAIENLIENAIVHNSDSPTVRVAAKLETPIHASTRAAGQTAIITVKDDGPGIPEHIQEVIFNGANITQLKHGSGLGLWVVRWIVESADGTVSYTRNNGWTKITLVLPTTTEPGDLTEDGPLNKDMT